jgi:peptidoglycan hydrolase-like protein with peptidoglycan-binding domain
MIHVAVGFPMQSLDFAAHHLSFWLHHNNIDRLYESFLSIEGYDECESEMRLQQTKLEGEGRTGAHGNLYTTWLEPFNHPVTGKPFYARHAFNTKKLGYMYDSLEPQPPQQMRQAPTYAVFENIHPADVDYKTFLLAVFIVPRGESLPVVPVSEWHSHPNLAGFGAVFGGKGQECRNCVESEPYNVTVNIEQALLRLGLKRSEATVVAMAELEGDGIARQIRETSIRPPVVRGPVFEDDSARLARGSTGEDVRALQTLLKRYGYYRGSVDGEMGRKTEDAVKLLQGRWSLAVDGVAGPVTIGQLLKKRMSGNKDLDTGVPNYNAGDTIRYFLGARVGYIRGYDFSMVFASCCAQWSRACGVEFEEVFDECKADLKVRFQSKTCAKLDAERVDDVYRFDGIGGELAHADKNFIELDAEERWSIDLVEGKFCLYPVLLHELGHVLGLGHGPHGATMDPYYPGSQLLTEWDVEAVQGLYGTPPPPGDPAKDLDRYSSYFDVPVPGT